MSSDGEWLLYQQSGPNTQLDIWLLPLTGDRKPKPYLVTPYNEGNAGFSPDGRWVVYDSDESGQQQIYVQSVPAGSAKYLISPAGGRAARWRGDGKEIYYISSDQKLTAVPIQLGGTVQPGSPQALFSVRPPPNAAVFADSYAVSRDGRRFLINEPVVHENGAAPPITVVLNWQAGLKKGCPDKSCPSRRRHIPVSLSRTCLRWCDTRTWKSFFSPTR